LNENEVLSLSKAAFFEVWRTRATTETPRSPERVKEDSR